MRDGAIRSRGTHGLMPGSSGWVPAAVCLALRGQRLSAHGSLKTGCLETCSFCPLLREETGFSQSVPEQGLNDLSYRSNARHNYFVSLLNLRG